MTSPPRELPDFGKSILVEADDLDPVGAFSAGIFLQQRQRAARLVDGIHRNRVGLFAAGEEETAVRGDGESTRLALGGRAAEVAQLPAARVYAERPKGTAGALGDIE